MPRRVTGRFIVAAAVASVMVVTFLANGPAFGVVVPPAVLVPLNQLAVPQPPTLFQYVKNKAAAVRLGKAFFWDMQVGSDGFTACATCHFSAGTDNRMKNTLNPGVDSVFQVRGPNEILQTTDFPFHERQAPADLKASPVLRDSNDVVGAQGVRLNQLMNIVPGVAAEVGAPIPDPVFHVNGANVRQVTGRNSPSVINAVFSFSNFWDGRASSFFNGSSPFGPLDQNAGIWVDVSNVLTKQPVNLRFASLASQATGPPLSEVEMSYRGRTFPQLGRKMLGLTPLGKQFVHPDDSELGNLSLAVRQPDGSLSGSRGLDGSYAQMIRDAFQSYLWSSPQQTQDGYTQMEANFPLFWGLAIQMYESTLVSDDTPFDRFLGGDTTALTAEQQDGFTLFFGAGRCDLCHGATELTNASVRVARFVSNADHGLLELMPVASGKQIVYDNGFNNTAVRPTSEDIGRGGLSPFLNPLTGLNFPLSFSSLSELQATGKLPFPTPELIPGLPANFPVANNGAFKVPGLRNVELTAPYMHNGSIMTLDDVVEFYTRGGNFPTLNKDNLDINIVELPALQGSPAAVASLVAFMKSMTDDRVKIESAPFDHPELFVPNGDSVNDADVLHLPAIGLFGLEDVTPSSVTVASSISSPQAPGTPVTFTASGHGGIGTYDYRFYLNDGNGFVLMRDYNPENTWTWTPSTSGNYDIFVEMRNAGSVALRDAYTSINFYQVRTVLPPTGLAVSPSVSGPVVSGTPVTFTATAQGGSGPYEYRFYLNSGSGFVLQQDYSPSNTFNWTPAAAGNYDIFVEARNIGSTALREVFSAVNFYQVQSVAAATGVSLSPSTASPQAPNTPLTFTATGQGGSGSYEYRFYLNSGAGFVLQQDYSPANTFNWTPVAAGNYDIFVEVRNAGSAAFREAYNAMYFYKIQ